LGFFSCDIIWFGCDFNREDLNNENSCNLLLGTNIGMKFGENAGHDKYETFIVLDFSIKF
jgi:hypothetical protein